MKIECKVQKFFIVIINLAYICVSINEAFGRGRQYLFISCVIPLCRKTHGIIISWEYYAMVIPSQQKLKQKHHLEILLTVTKQN